MLEATQHGDNSFITLTYNEAHKPLCNSVQIRDYQLFLKRLRKHHGKFRYFLVGEYGETNHRPHYHAILFGYPTCTHGGTTYTKYRSRCCSNCDTISDLWSLGQVHLGNVTPESIQYVCGYVTKKMTNKLDPRLEGRNPEFARMSLNPGIGLNFMHEVANTFLSFDLETRQADVPVSLSHGMKKLPLGRYLRRKLRLMVGHDEKAPQNIPSELQQKMQTLLQDTLASKKTGEYFNFRDTLYEAGKTRVASLEYKHKLYPKRDNT